MASDEGYPPGILKARAAQAAFGYTRRVPAPELAPFVEHYWLLSWDLRGRPPHEQLIVPHPCVQMTFKLEEDQRRARIAGVIRGLYRERIHGRGCAVGVRFRPGGFRPFLRSPVSSITGQFVALGQVFGDRSPDLKRRVFDAPGTCLMADVVDAFLRAAAPDTDADAQRAAAITARIRSQPRLTRVDDLACEIGVGIRSLQRLFSEYVGVSPKWVIRRYRIHEAAERAAAGTDVEWAQLAVDLGYYDQAHFTRDFTALTGTSPARYARACAPAREGARRPGKAFTAGGG